MKKHALLFFTLLLLTVAAIAQRIQSPIVVKQTIMPRNEFIKFKYPVGSVGETVQLRGLYETLSETDKLLIMQNAKLSMKDFTNRMSISKAPCKFCPCLLYNKDCPPPPPPPPPPTTPTVISRIEKAGNLDNKIYLQEPANSTNRKGLIVLAEGNNEQNVSLGDVNGAFLNDLAKQLATQGYIAAIVAYRPQPALAANYSNWQSNCEMLATDLDNAASGIINKYGTTRSNLIFGGLSYGSYALLSANGTSNILSGAKGVLATCGATGTWQAGNFKIPIYNLACNNGNGKGFESDGQYNFQGGDLINAINNTTVKNASSYLIDNSCNTHCGGNQNSWVQLLVAKVKAWIP